VKPTERFSDRVADYVRYRPRYPQEIVDVLAGRAGLTPSWVIADVGSGTGFSAQPFLDNGNVVFCVEPNAAMRLAAQTLLGGYAGFRSVDGTAEATTLGDASVDMVVVAQAFHWLDPVATRHEFVRILRPGGWCVIVWNSRRTEASAFLRAYERLLVQHGTDYGAVRHDHVDASALERFFGAPCRRDVLYNEQALDLAGLQGRILSSSYTPAEGDPRRAALLRDAERLFNEYAADGRVVLEYDTEIYAAPLRA
jgi:SAM-dependent methyltransferase